MIEGPRKAVRNFREKEFMATQRKFEELERERNIKGIVREEVEKERQGKTSRSKDLNMLLYIVLDRLVKANPRITAMNKKKLPATLAHNIRLINVIELEKQESPIKAVVWKQITTHALKQLTDPKCWKVFGMKKEKIRELWEKAEKEKQALSTARAHESFRPEFSFIKDLYELNQKFLQEELGTQAEEMIKQFRLVYPELEYESEHW